MINTIAMLCFYFGDPGSSDVMIWIINVNKCSHK